MPHVIHEIETVMKLAIVILNWNGASFLEKFLPYLSQNTPLEYEIVVADNGSKDDSISFLQTHYPDLRLIQFDINYGFAGGYNKALEQIDAEYYCILNSDIEVTPGWVDPILKMLDENPHIAAVQPKILSYDKRTHFEYAGASGGFLDFLGYPFCRGRLFNVVEEDRNQYDTPMPIFWATGAALFVRSSVYHELKGFDADFFAHMEEIDFCWRIHNHGYEIWVEPASVVYHVGGGSLPKSNPFKTYLNFRNNWFLLIKNLPINKLHSTLWIRFFMDQVAAFSFLLTGKWGEFKAVWKGIYHALKDYKKTKAKREILPDNGYFKTYPYSSVVQYYLKRKRKFNGVEME